MPTAQCRRTARPSNRARIARWMRDLMVIRRRANVRRRGDARGRASARIHLADSSVGDGETVARRAGDAIEATAVPDRPASRARRSRREALAK